MELLFKLNHKLCENGKRREKDEKRANDIRIRAYTPRGAVIGQKSMCVCEWLGWGSYRATAGIEWGLERVMSTNPPNDLLMYCIRFTQVFT